ncbi:ADP-ribosylation factor [Tetrabaena socialis]|uniref:ADP-ribosylation factor n=1 Tax=Tetrabaena socialis TaxID=47790 RepID=A0A2J8ABS3_9CHLO|nr:ADP-ribosylation factor [Tetrabaena socialis]|eukprot:PNH09923.1 ADP-ribosylation factor [Tetrabaena socialis]
MPSAVTTLLERLFPRKLSEGRLLCVGLDAAGRTSWLYSLIFPGENLVTIPTIGFNVETVKDGDMALTIWDVGGCDKIRPLWRHYFQNTDSVVFVVDAHDTRLDEVTEEVRRLMGAEELHDVPCLVIANKQDLHGALSHTALSERMQLPQIMGKRMWTCMPGALHNKELTSQHLRWLVSAVKHKRCEDAKPATTASDPPAPKQAGKDAAGGMEAPDAAVETVLERWLLVEDEPDDEFLQKLEDYSLETWDHRTHLRLAWLYLTRHGRREGMARIHASIAAFIANSPVTKRKTGTTYHATMTHFFGHMVHFAIVSMKLPPGASGPDAAPAPLSSHPLPSVARTRWAGATSDFRTFLVLTPTLSNGALYLHYYTKKLMLMTPESRSAVVLPDKRPLPSILSDLTARPAADKQGCPQAPKLTDAAFLERFQAGTLDRWNHECLLRAIYCCLGHGRRRGVSMALDGLRSLQKDGFHLTLSYFWIQMLTQLLASDFNRVLFGEPAAGVTMGSASSGSVSTVAPGEDAQPPSASERATDAAPSAGLPEWTDLLGSTTYTSVRLKELIADGQRYLRFYSKKVVYSELAASQFVPPDRRPLPTTVDGV